MADQRTDSVMQTTREMYHAEYCTPGGISNDECMEELRVPPLTTSLRFNQMSSCFSEIVVPDDQERMIRKSLVDTNRNRFADVEELEVGLRVVDGVSDTWICFFDRADGICSSHLSTLWSSFT
ncbi:hypothetical protein RvY_07699-2 [Ramazzottius varieornatus]|uniref:Uncharacterized protein n=1 Tax=Ramazzottius varieornatus TaxID=947166 RepID=A0A1D1V357_RAMVA|nr:hypothetical protein RvY_07699-2 [Ramazzottius varieornatus]